MKERLSRVRLLKRLYHQFCWQIYVLLAALLVLIGVSKHPLISRVRIEIANVSSAVVNVLYKPVEGIGYAWDYISGYVAVHDENIKLKDENQKLLYYVNQVEQLVKENAALKKQLNFVLPQSYQYWTAYISADNGGTFSRSVLVNLGRKNGIKKGFAVLYNDGLLGRVEEVGYTTCQILLLTDYASRVPVLVGQNEYTAIAEGNNGPLLKLTLLPEDAEVKIGDYVSTSGQGGVYPKGLAVGVVAKVRKNKFYVKPFVSREDTQFVRIVDFRQSGLLDRDVCECSKDQ
ncbi:MAG: rod shape-determining protein MreC [Alphaproteobacteria bacterium]